MAEFEPIEIINNSTEIIEDSNNTEVIEDKPIEIVDRRKLRKGMKKTVEDAPPVEKIDKRKILRALWRTTILEDGTTKYNNKPCDPLYFKKYYDEKRKEKEATVITCELCQRKIAGGHILRHQRSNNCKKIYNQSLIPDEKPSDKLI